MESVAVVGRFPPPLDGQAVATARLADLVDGPDRAVVRVDVGAPEGDRVVAPGTAPLRRVAHTLGLASRVRRQLATAPGAPVLWPSVSPSPLGHARDRLTVVPAFGDRPVVGVVHRGDFDRLFASPWTRRSGRQLVRRLAALVFLTERLADACADHVPDAKRVVIPNTIGDDVIPGAAVIADKQQSWSARPDRARLRLLYLSAMIPSKGYARVLEATAVLRERRVPVRTTFAGRWPSEAAERAFARRVQQLGLADCVDVRGGVSREEAGALHLAADLLVLPTTYPVEAQPLVVLEALAAGTPVLASRHAGLPEMLSDGHEGFFIRSDDPSDIAHAAQRAAADWPARSRAARHRFEQAYSPAAVREQWLELIARLG